MNIFVLDNDIETSAKFHTNSHVIKQSLEQCQILCTTINLLGGTSPYRTTHPNHPCTIWARQSIENYNLLCKMTIALCKEYTFRYGKTHACEKVAEYCFNNAPKLDSKGITPFALAMPDEYKNESAVDSYEIYYISDKRHLFGWNFFNWKNRDVPPFVVEAYKEECEANLGHS